VSSVPAHPRMSAPGVNPRSGRASDRVPGGARRSSAGRRPSAAVTFIESPLRRLSSGPVWGPLSAVLLLALWLAAPSAARADAVVLVRVQAAGEAVDGRVTLTRKDDGSERRTCQTRAGRCRIPGVPGGRYVVRFQPEEGDSPPDRTVMIPPEGEVTLVVSGERG